MAWKDQLEKKKEKTRGGKHLFLAEPTKADNDTEEPPGSTGWTQKQQKALETALATYTKGCSDRWDRIAKAVPEKTKVWNKRSFISLDLMETLLFYF